MRDVVCPPGLQDRLDRVLPRLLADVSRGAARRLIAAGAVFVDGHRCRVASRLIRPGSRLRVDDPRPPAPAPAVAVLHRDDACIAVDKPAGMPAAPTRKAAAGTALEVVAQQIGGERGRHPRLWLVHRLDRETSGVLLFALTRDAARRLGAAFQERRVEKEYLAWVAGRVDAESGAVVAPLRAVGLRASVDPLGREAETRWHVEERRGERTLLRLVPTTGRMHQIRVHLQSIGHPVVGDRAYGGPPAPRLMLHASRLLLRHPSSGELLDIATPPPW